MFLFDHETFIIKALFEKINLASDIYIKCFKYSRKFAIGI